MSYRVVHVGTKESADFYMRWTAYRFANHMANKYGGAWEVLDKNGSVHFRLDRKRSCVPVR